MDTHRSHKDEARSLLQGAIDLHVHSAPDGVRRRFDDLELARETLANGLAGVVIKSHLGETAARAALTSRHVQGVEVSGGVVLNASVGGLNPFAVEASLKLGGKIVWMPTLDAAHHRSQTGGSGGITILNRHGRLRSEVQDILDLVREGGAALSTGHLSPDEVRALRAEAQKAKVHALLITHPEFWITFLPLEAQQELQGGNVFFERCFYASTLKGAERTPFSQSVDWIKSLGFESTIISSDLGQAHNPAPAEGLEMMIAELLEAGLSADHIRRMLVSNPRYALG